MTSSRFSRSCNDPDAEPRSSFFRKLFSALLVKVQVTASDTRHDARLTAAGRLRVTRGTALMIPFSENGPNLITVNGTPSLSAKPYMRSWQSGPLTRASTPDSSGSGPQSRPIMSSSKAAKPALIVSVASLNLVYGFFVARILFASGVSQTDEVSRPTG